MTGRLIGGLLASEHPRCGGRCLPYYKAFAGLLYVQTMQETVDDVALMRLDWSGGSVKALPEKRRRLLPVASCNVSTPFCGDRR